MIDAMPGVGSLISCNALGVNIKLFTSVVYKFKKADVPLAMPQSPQF
jgi:hypothetical protein